MSSGGLAKDFRGWGTRGKLTSRLCIQHAARKPSSGLWKQLSPLLWLFALGTRPASSSFSSGFQRKPLLSAENVGGPQHPGWKLPFCPLKSRLLQDPFFSKTLSCRQLGRRLPLVFAVTFSMLGSEKEGRQFKVVASMRHHKFPSLRTSRERFRVSVGWGDGSQPQPGFSLCSRQHPQAPFCPVSKGAAAQALRLPCMVALGLLWFQGHTPAWLLGLCLIAWVSSLSLRDTWLIRWSHSEWAGLVPNTLPSISGGWIHAPGSTRDLVGDTYFCRNAMSR